VSATRALASAGERPRALAWVPEALALCVLALVVNGLAAHFITQPGYTDAYYYFGGARQLASGQGFSEPYLWNYLTPLPAAEANGPPWPSHLYWMPLVSIVAAPFIAIALRLAPTTPPNAILFRAAQVPFILFASALPLLAYGVARQLGGLRRHALAAGLLTLFSPFYFAYWTTTDAFALYALLAAGALVLTALAQSQPAQWGRWLFSAGLAAGLAALTRADGLLLVACLLAWVGLRPTAGLARRETWPARLAAAGAVLAGFALVMIPWYVRNWIVVGAPLTPGTARTLWLTNYDDLFTFAPDRLTLAAYLASGLGAIVSGKWQALVANLETLVVVQCGIIAFPFSLAGLWRLRHNNLMRLAVFYGLSLLAVMTVLFTFPGARGGYFHSGSALLPFYLAAAVVGLDVVVEAVARRLRHWQPERSKPVFTVLLVAGAILLTLAVWWKRVLAPGLDQATWATTEQVYGEAGEWLKDNGQTSALAAVNDPPGWAYWTSLPAIVIPNGDAATLRQAMTAYGARWLVLDENRPAPLSQLYAAPDSQSAFILRARFMDSAGQPTELFELRPGP
jgi:hypothetical protein